MRGSVRRSIQWEMVSGDAYSRRQSQDIHMVGGRVRRSIQEKIESQYPYSGR